MTGHPRVFGEDKSKKAAMLLLHWNKSFASADSSSAELVKFVVGHTVSSRQIVEVGLPALHKGWFGYWFAFLGVDCGGLQMSFTLEPNS